MVSPRTVNLVLVHMERFTRYDLRCIVHGFLASCALNVECQFLLIKPCLLLLHAVY
jgi:hypothetical protein